MLSESKGWLAVFSMSKHVSQVSVASANDFTRVGAPKDSD